MNISIDIALPNDAKEIIEFTKIVGAETDNLTFDGKGINSTVEASMKYIEMIQNSPDCVFLVAKDSSKIIGTASYNTFSGERKCHRGEFAISVQKKYWNKGIGTKLLDAIIDFAKNNAKAEIISLEVRSDNAAAIHLYKKFGFVKIGTFKGYFKIDGQLIDFDIMQLVL